MSTKNTQNTSSEVPLNPPTPQEDSPQNYMQLSGEERRQLRLEEQRRTGKWTMRPEEIAARKGWIHRIVEEMNKIDPNNPPDTP